MFKVKVFGPNTSQKYDVDVFEVEARHQVSDHEGSLHILLQHIPEQPHPTREGEKLPALQSRSIIYPPGGWTKVVIDEAVR